MTPFMASTQYQYLIKSHGELEPPGIPAHAQWCRDWDTTVVHVFLTEEHTLLRSGPLATSSASHPYWAIWGKINFADLSAIMELHVIVMCRNRML